MLPPELVSRLRCPACGGRIAIEEDGAACPEGRHRYPVIHGIPLLVDETACIVPHDVILRAANAFTRTRGRTESWAKRLIPNPSVNVTAGRVRAGFSAAVAAGAQRPTILLVGGGEDDRWARSNPDARVVSSDLFPYAGTDVLCDALRIPFEDGTFDGVAIIAVLEHVTDPWQAVAEIHRVLRPGGIVLAETPFMQQVHGGAFDFTRFTDLGHRRLFRRFEEIERGACCGAGMALAWSYKYFLLSLLGGGRRRRQLVTAFAYLTSFWLGHLDRWILARPESLDAAAGVYFLGRRADDPLEDRALVGAVPRGHRSRRFRVDRT